MVGARGRRVKAALVLTALFALSACFWRSFGRVVEVHVDVLVGTARKGADLVAKGRLTAESMPELMYPLERATAFARKAAARARGVPPQSLAAFEQLLARYRTFVDTLDQTRRTTRPAEAGAALAQPLAAVETAAEAVRTALRSEDR